MTRLRQRCRITKTLDVIIIRTGACLNESKGFTILEHAVQFNTVAFLLCKEFYNYIILTTTSYLLSNLLVQILWKTSYACGTISFIGLHLLLAAKLNPIHIIYDPPSSQTPTPQQAAVSKVGKIIGGGTRTPLKINGLKLLKTVLTRLVLCLKRWWSKNVAGALVQTLRCQGDVGVKCNGFNKSSRIITASHTRCCCCR